MGMGEPADNVDAVVAATYIWTHAQQFQLAPRRVTISTVAPTPQAFPALGTAPAVLAWSLHTANDALRKQLIPTVRYSVSELGQALIATLQQRSKRMRTIMLEVTLLQEINDTIEAAHEIAHFVQDMNDQVTGLKVVINLIPWNSIHPQEGDDGAVPSGSTGRTVQIQRYRPPSDDRIQTFQRELVQHYGLKCYIRTTRGDEQSSACGQLATTTTTRTVSKKKQDQAMKG
jgi:23S rRNA (adenine2503-C2)-methyltransferase